MKISRQTGSKFWVVSVDKDELHVASGRSIPYGAWIGTIDDYGKINIWTPAAYVPRGYKEAARLKLEEARQKLYDRGELKSRSGHMKLGLRSERVVVAGPKGARRVIRG